jgi:hypothetical protein
VVERYAIKELHDYEGAAILLADIVCGANAPGGLTEGILV